MEQSKNPGRNVGHFVLSHELLQLLIWLMENEPDSLKKIIARALSKGLKEHIKSSQELNNTCTAQEAQYTIIEFLSMLEALLYETSHEHLIAHALQRNLIPASGHVDQKLINTSTVESSVAAATLQADGHPEKDAQDIFLKEILKRWKPSKKTISH